MKGTPGPLRSDILNFKYLDITHKKVTTRSKFEFYVSKYTPKNILFCNKGLKMHIIIKKII